ncbi:MAG: shikimate kinase, partial [Planctomycetota bacterium]
SSDAIYLRFCVGELAPFWEAFLAHGGRGLSITAPLKEQAAALARSPDDDVVESGAANTLLADGRACNTDVRAFLDLVPAGVGPALVLGAGGAARAAVTALTQLGYSVSVYARDPQRAKRLGVPLADRPDGAPLVVNATPAVPPPADLLIDLRYGPGIHAPAHGIGGLEFLETQARHQYRVFFGCPYPEPVDAAGVLLVGPRGAGKTKLGARLAEALGWPFVDSDHAVALAENASIAALLAEDRLRAAEARWLGERLQGPPCVLAAGGGAVCWDGLTGAAAGWKTIWLDAPAEVLAKRLLDDPGGRPSLTGRPPHEEIAALRDEREALYRNASSWREDTSTASLENIVLRITARLLQS